MGLKGDGYLGLFNRIEGKLDDAVEGVASSMFKSPIEPAQIAKRAEKRMHREKLVGAGTQYAPTLYTVLVNVEDDRRLFGFYPTMAAETETYIMGKAQEAGYTLEVRPLVRFIADEKMKSGKFDVIAEIVTSRTIRKHRLEEEEFYGQGPVSAQADLGDMRADANPMKVRASSPHAPASSPGIPDIPEIGGGAANAADLRIPAAAAVPLVDVPDFPPVEAKAAPLPAPIEAAPATASQAPPTQKVFPEAVLYDARNNIEYLLDTPRILLGREDADIILNDSSVSRQHAELFLDGNSDWNIRDLGSTNGTKLNSRRIDVATLKTGDRISLGMTLLEFTRE
jgi:hypothetical protein